MSTRKIRSDAQDQIETPLCSDERATLLREPTVAFRPAIDTPRSARGLPSRCRAAFAYLVINGLTLLSLYVVSTVKVPCVRTSHSRVRIPPAAEVVQSVAAGHCCGSHPELRHAAGDRQCPRSVQWRSIAWSSEYQVSRIKKEY